MKLGLLHSPSLTMSMPASTCLRTISRTFLASAFSYAASSTLPPSKRACSAASMSAGRGRLPVWVVRMRSMLGFMDEVYSSPRARGPCDGGAWANRLSGQARKAGGRVQRRRADRPAGAVHRRSSRDRPRPARDPGDPSGRRRTDRHAGRPVQAEGRIQPAPLHALRVDQRGGLQERRLQAFRPRADHPDLALLLRRRALQRGPGAGSRRVHRLRARQPRQAQLRHDRPRLGPGSARARARESRRNPPDRHSVQGRRRRGERPHRGPGASLRFADAQRPAAIQGRTAARPRRHEPRAPRRRAANTDIDREGARLRALRLARPPRRRGALAATSPERLAAAPQIPTLTEKGLAFVRFGWLGLCGGAGTPQPVIALLNRQGGAIVKSPEYRDLIEKAGSVAVSSSPEQLAQILHETYEQTAGIAREFGLQMD